MTSITRTSNPLSAARRTRTMRRAVLSAALLGGVAGCLDLNVTDPNGLGITTVFTNAANTEAALIGSWKAYTDVNRGSCPTLPFAVWGDEITTTSVSYIDYSMEPRIPINNRDNLNCTTRYGYWSPFESSAGARESFQGIRANNLKFGAITAATPDGADTPSRLIFAKFIIAINTFKHGLYFDQAFIADTAMTPGDRGITFSPSAVVLATARAELRNIIADARATTAFTWPATFINGRAITRDELIRIAYSYLVKADVYAPRNPAERATVNWAAVLARLIPASPATSGIRPTRRSREPPRRTSTTRSRRVPCASATGYSGRPIRPDSISSGIHSRFPTAQRSPSPRRTVASMGRPTP